MREPFTVAVPTPAGDLILTFSPGQSTIFVGPNGAGKTRLGVHLEDRFPREKVQRIAAHRSLTMNESLNATSLERALKGLFEGYTEPGASREDHRWKRKPAVSLLNDYDFLMQALFAEQSRTAVDHLEKHRARPDESPPVTILSRLKAVWERLLPHRSLRLREMGVEVLLPGAQSGRGYSGSDMSDGERVIFYMLGQCLLAPKDGFIVIDEPELHIHKAILGKLWDAIEAERPDCSFVYISHDLDFVVARPTASKFVIRQFMNIAQPSWDIEPLPVDSELPERLVSELVGSRQPVLFVEGDRESLDATIYRNVYRGFLVVPAGSCDSVIHGIASYRKNAALHRIGKVFGCVDADARSADEIVSLSSLGVSVLPVAEVENCLLIPKVFSLIATAFHHTPDDAATFTQQLTLVVMECARRDVEEASVRYASRRLDAQLKRLAPSARTIADLAEKFRVAIAGLDPQQIASSYRKMLEAAIVANDLAAVLAIYDNKGLLSAGAKILGFKNRGSLVEFVGRLLGAEDGAALLTALQEVLPKIPLS